MKWNSIAMAGVFAFLLVMADALRAAPTNITVVLTNRCQVTGFLVSRSSSNVVVSVGGGQNMSFAAGEISSLKLTDAQALPSPAAVPLSAGPRSQASNPPTHITLALTNGAMVAGVLVSQSSSNFVVWPAGGRKLNIARRDVQWFKLTASPAVAPPQEAAFAGVPRLPSTNSIAAQFNLPHTEDEMRAMLRTPEGAALLKSVCDSVIGPGADPQTKAATESYYKTVDDFEAGKIGIVELQVQAQAALGNLSQRQGQTGDDPQAARWNDFKQILQGFVNEPAPTPVAPLQ